MEKTLLNFQKETFEDKKKDMQMVFQDPHTSLIQE